MGHVLGIVFIHVRHVAFHLIHGAHHAGIIQIRHRPLRPRRRHRPRQTVPSAPRGMAKVLICLDIFLLRIWDTPGAGRIDPLGKEIEYHPAFRTGKLHSMALSDYRFTIWDGDARKK